ncbi:ABC transporter permease [Candidatus Uhrbacteria bacterium]|nr:ABC transporter permease [Candidatus Uhrbacteria bacterium]
MFGSKVKKSSGDQVVVYEPDVRTKDGFFRSLGVMATNIVSSRELIWQLFVRDFTAVHRKSFLGMAWVVIGPVFGILSWVFMNATGVLNPGDVGIPYPAYVLLGTTFWGLFMSFYQMSAETLNAGAGFIMQVRYPHEALLAKQIMQALANFLVSFLVILAVLLVFRVIPSWKIVLLPAMILPMLFLGAGIGLFISTVGVVAVEIRKICDLFLGMLIFFTPIIYAGSAAGGSFAAIVRWNPLTYLVGGVRDVVAYGRMDNPIAYGWAALLAFILFAVSWRLFYVSEEKVIEKMI